MSHFSNERGRNESQTGRGGSKKRRVLTLVVAGLVVVALALGGGFASGLFNANDYPGGGTGEVQFTIAGGENGESIAINLAKAGVIKSSKSFYSLLLDTEPEPVFIPGIFKLKQHMSNASALAALQDSSNLIEDKVVIPEGTTLKATLNILSKSLNIPLADLQAATSDPRAYPGVPLQAETLEGFLFPATYKFSPGVDATTVIKTMVANSIYAMNRAGISADDRWKRLILASIIQKEMSAIPGDAKKISRVFYNRVDAGMNLGSDVTMCYGKGLEGDQCLFPLQSDLDDASNPYNTRKNSGLPIGPICNPGQEAIDAAEHPADGSWLFFVTVNLKTGETVFTSTNAEHDAAVRQYKQWLKDNNIEG